MHRQIWGKQPGDPLRRVPTIGSPRPEEDEAAIVFLSAKKIRPACMGRFLFACQEEFQCGLLIFIRRSSAKPHGSGGKSCSRGAVWGVRGPKANRERDAKRKTGFQRMIFPARKRRMTGHETVRSWLIRNLHLQLMCRSRSGDARRLLPTGRKGSNRIRSSRSCKNLPVKKETKKDVNRLVFSAGRQNQAEKRGSDVHAR
ncbi:MAG: hypothetical protein C6P37_13735 [Caldibacillus debilis]|uniref:Uncharacterized protein n=1 Tax=Caldibacillus debilis TaxID=301148 RepID=A0A3E0K125_9BACI|nr:MAG: hypothetical protein C6P37_13735 [Caldibacillus debilis]